MAFKFKNLRVWNRAVDLSAEFSEFVKSSPKDELYVLSSQIRRASGSISLNIAEGLTGQSNLEFKKLLGYSLRSAVEVVGCQKSFDLFYDKLTELIKGIQALRNSIKAIT